MTDLNLKCPCKDCICIPVCRHKSYNVLFMDCELLNDYEPSYKSMYARDENRITIVLEILKPSRWDYVYRQGYRHKEYGKALRTIEEI